MKPNQADKVLQAQLQKSEAEKIKDRILSLTDKIPPQVLNGNHQIAVQFKLDAISARKQAESKRMDINKLRLAHQRIATYY